jgi:hypothetical protein
MKKLLLILLSLALGLLSLMAQDKTGDRVVIPLSEPGKAVTLSASLLNGSIKVTGYEGKDVIVESMARGKVIRDEEAVEENEDVMKPSELRSTGRKEREEKHKNRAGMKKIGGGIGSGLVVTEKDNTVEVAVQSPWASIDIDIKVPFNTSLKLHAVNGGAIVVNGVGGSHEIQHVNGKITMENIAGSVLANTTNGDVTVRFKSLDPKAEMSFSSFNGDVDVSFPGETKADIRFSTEQGEVYSDFELAGRSVTDQKVQDRRSTGGRYEVRFDKSIHGTINGGGQKLTFKTFNGDILLRKTR